MKIKHINICNYRAFLIKGDEEENRYAIDLPNGENLLIYGENGSGKSSLFKALKEFFASATNTQQVFQKNLFYEEIRNSEQPFICVRFEDDREHYFSAESVRTNTQDNLVITEANITKGFISYQDLLKLHFRQNNKAPDLFSFFLGDEGLFSNIVVPAPMQPANKMPFNSLWKKIKERMDKDALSDYNTNIAAQFYGLETKVNLLLRYFHNDCNLRLIYNEGEINEGNLKLPTVSLETTLFGEALSEHDDVLNEARLTAIAISIYLAFIQSLPVTNLRLLFLDDIFIGLDMSNRIPLIKILTDRDLGDGTSFEDFQIFLTTYDREWFNVAMTYLNDNWTKTEFYVDNHTCTTERPLIRRWGTYKERAEFQLIQGDYPACANYLRKAFEQELGRIIPENILHPGFSTVSGNNSVVAISKKRLAITENDDTWFFKLKNEEYDTDIQTFKFVSLQQMITLFKNLVEQYRIPFNFINELNSVKNRLLNPLAHDDLKSSIYKADLMTGFEILSELQEIHSKVILTINNSSPIQLHCLKDDHTGKKYLYKFELRENLRLIHYNTFKTFLNASLHSLSMEEAENPSIVKSKEHDYPSLKKLCEAIFATSVPRGTESGFYDNFIFDEVYTIENKKLSELI